MTNLVPLDPNLLALLRGAFGKEGLPLPYTHEIFLLVCSIAGTFYHDVEEFEDELHEQDLLILKREPQNTHDALAILILDQRGRSLGYVPCAQNAVLARLMDAGKFIFGKLEQKEKQEHHLELQIRIFMRDV